MRWQKAPVDVLHAAEALAAGRHRRLLLRVLLLAHWLLLQRRLLLLWLLLLRPQGPVRPVHIFVCAICPEVPILPTPAGHR